MASSADIVIKPIVTEKSTALASNNTYCFKVEKHATRTQVKLAIEKLFAVKVERVNTVNYRGKIKRLGVHEGRRPDWKKAFVTLREGDKIPMFEGL